MARFEKAKYNTRSFLRRSKPTRANLRRMKQNVVRFGHFLERKVESIPAHQLIPLSFAVISLIGTLLLLLPFATKKGETTTLLNALFVATSCTCVTGLVPFDTGTHWSLFGQTVIALLIQIGGLGIMTIVTSLTLSLRQRLGLRNLRIAQEATGYLDMGGTRGVLKTSTMITLSCEAIGALLLSFRFVPLLGWKEGIKNSVFTAISAYCNAGFDVLGRGDSFCSFYNDSYLCLVLSVLIIIGGIGFAVFYDIINVVRERRRARDLMMHTKIVCITSAVLIVLGTVVFFILEYGHTLRGMPFGDKLLVSFFQSVCARSAGFATVDHAGLSSYTKLFYSLLMFIGASPGSTGGGIKTTTLVVLVFTILCTLRGYEHPLINRRRITRDTINKAITITAVGLLVVLTSSVVIIVQLSGVMPLRAIDVFYEATGAFGTTGISVGITSHMPPLSILTLCVTMFIGRVGPISITLAISNRRKNTNCVYPDATIISG